MASSSEIGDCSLIASPSLTPSYPWITPELHGIVPGSLFKQQECFRSRALFPTMAFICLDLPGFTMSQEATFIVLCVCFHEVSIMFLCLTSDYSLFSVALVIWLMI